jgi:hypothetical protein
MTELREILYCHAKRATRKVGPGHWFFHTGQWAQCAQAWKTKKGYWQVQVSFAPFGKKVPEHAPTFASIEEVQQFVGEYFRATVIEVRPDEFPDVD